MSNMQSTDQPATSSLHWPALVQMILSLVAALFLFGAAVLIVLTALFSARGTSPRDPTEPFMVAGSLAFAGVLVLPSAWYAWRHIGYPDREPTPRPERRRVGLILTIIVIILVGGALWLGNWAAENNYHTWLLLPPLNIIATGLPALWVIYLGTRGLIPGAPRRKWGVFATGLVLGPLVILVLELILLVIMGVIGLFWIMLNPTLANQLNGLVYRLQNAGPNLDTIVKSLVPFLSNPGIIFLVFAFLSVLVPLIEEALKPIGVWFMVGQRLTPAQGFAYGIMSGAGFGLFENLGNTSGGATNWALMASTRMSTLLLHCFTAGIMGWALVYAWNEKRYIRLAVTYVIAVIIHGLWNGLALLSLTSSLPAITTPTLPANLPQAAIISALGIVALGVIVFILYFGANLVFQRSAQVQSQPSLGASQQSTSIDDNRASVTDEPVQPTAETSIGQSSSTEEKTDNPEDEASHQHIGDDSTTTG